MNGIRRIVVAFSLLTSMLFALAGVLTPASAAAHGVAKEAYGGTIDINASPATLDPGTTRTQPSSAPLFSLIYGQLYRDNPKGALSDDLALAYDLSPDGLTVTIPLRHGVAFQDGTAFNAAAVAFNINRDEHGDSAGRCPCSPFLTDIKSVSARGKYTVVIHLIHRNLLLHDFLAESAATYIVSPTALQREGEAQFGLAPVGAGPYRVTSFVPGTSGEVDKFAHSYEAKSVHVQAIKWQKISSDAALIAGCQSQTVSVCTFGDTNLATDPAQIQSSVPSVLHEINSPRVNWTRLQFNVYSPPFNDQVARQAIQEATDPSKLLSFVAGNPSVTCGLIASGNEFYWGSSCPVGVPSYNPAGAAKLVASLPGGTLKFQAMYSSILPALVNMWNAIPGITATPEIVPHSTEVANQASGNFNMIAPGAGGGFIDPVLGAEPYIAAGSPQNAYGYKSSKLDALLTRVETAKSTAQETKLWEDYNALDLSEEGDIGLYQGNNQNWVNNAINGLSFSGFDVYYDRVWCTNGVCTH